ncbi:hypothetical protein J2W22_000129 [Sphingomonas kyeonggiensis]|uniref:hypothetical protein n=1 Tax=Sphingomonas kyeonggiensis TaxID=1268553 RepID=UPI0027869713|nr:hypothetical protein [Sphingomonas kyeonggiensis]MDQ0248082.1 hypothetical protein [Sphingomonas kyeonggiensis]
MKKSLLLALVLLAGCSAAKTEKQSVSLVLDADFTTGKLLLNCRDSSSGTCHVLVAGSGEPVFLSAAKGTTSEGDGAKDGARFCAGTAVPQNGCSLTVLRNGEQIYRSSQVKSETR